MRCLISFHYYHYYTHQCHSDTNTCTNTHTHLYDTHTQHTHLCDTCTHTHHTQISMTHTSVSHTHLCDTHTHLCLTHKCHCLIHTYPPPPISLWHTHTNTLMSVSLTHTLIHTHMHPCHSDMHTDKHTCLYIPLSHITHTHHYMSHTYMSLSHTHIQFTDHCNTHIIVTCTWCHCHTHTHTHTHMLLWHTHTWAWQFFSPPALPGKRRNINLPDNIFWMPKLFNTCSDQNTKTKQMMLCYFHSEKSCHVQLQFPVLVFQVITFIWLSFVHFWVTWTVSYRMSLSLTQLHSNFFLRSTL